MKGLGVRLFSFLCVVVLLAACSDSPPGNEVSGRSLEQPPQEEEAKLFENYVETGDLDAIQQHETIRLLAPRREYLGLTRKGLPSEDFQSIAESFAKKLDLKVQWLMMDSPSELIDALSRGEGDIIVAPLTHTPDRVEKIEFTLPLAQASEWIVTPNKMDAITEISHFKGLRFAVPAGSSYAESLKKIAQENPDIPFSIHEYGSDPSPDTAIDLINTEDYDATVLDNNFVKILDGYRFDFKTGMMLSKVRPVSWAVRRDNPKLVARLNEYLTRFMVVDSKQIVSKSDLPEIRKRKTLRMITRNTPTSYFVWRGELMGFEYELLKRFADRQGLLLEVEVAPPGTDLIQWLEDGRGDVIAASMTVTDERRGRGVEFTRFYNKVREQFVTHVDNAPIDTLEDLAGRTVVINRRHAYWATAQKLIDEGASFRLVEAPSDMSSDEILGNIAIGKYDVTLIDSHLVAIENLFSDTLQIGLSLHPARQHGWAVRKDNPQLLAALNTFLFKHYRGLFYNITYQKYFKDEQRMNRYQGERQKSPDALSPYDDLVKALAEEHHFDWRMIIAQMYQESKFDPKARSFAGAEGLMQVMPRTAKELGYSLPLTPQTGIQAGVRYLAWTRDRFESHLPLEERLWFALAAYNAGHGHVYDARRLAVKQGWDPDRWFGNVEMAMLLLSKKQYYTRSRYGYVRGAEPVRYVREIRDRYYAYLALERS